MSYLEPIPDPLDHDVAVTTEVVGVPDEVVETPVAETAPVDERQPAPESIPVDLEPIAIDLADAEAALGRLDAGTYWTSEISGVELPDELLAASPATRRLPGE